MLIISHWLEVHALFQFKNEFLQCVTVQIPSLQLFFNINLILLNKIK